MTLELHARNNGDTSTTYGVVEILSLLEISAMGLY